MKIVKIVFNFYINASIHVAFSVYAFAKNYRIYLDLPYNET